MTAYKRVNATESWHQSDGVLSIFTVLLCRKIETRQKKDLKISRLKLETNNNGIADWAQINLP